MFLQMIANHELTMLQKKENFIAWLKVFAEKVGDYDYMPDQASEAIILPYLKFEGVYLEYKQEKAHQKEDYCHYSYSCCIFNEDISNIRLVRQKGSFAAAKFVRATKHRF